MSLGLHGFRHGAGTRVGGRAGGGGRGDRMWAGGRARRGGPGGGLQIPHGGLTEAVLSQGSRPGRPAIAREAPPPSAPRRF